MKKDFCEYTTAEFAGIHEVNKRTLHYYDKIGLFAPYAKGGNHYRYYSSSQSMEFEYIRMLKELGMSIDEIKAYVKNPNAKDFIAIADKKTAEIDQMIVKLKQTKNLLQAKKAQVQLSENKENMEIEIVQCRQERFVTAPYSFQDDDMPGAFSYMKSMWGIEQCRAGVGSYISLEKVQENNFSEYDGLFAPALNTKNKKVFVKPAGKYLCGYCKGTWDKLPEAYEKMLSYADTHNLQLTGYAYERGLNDFAIELEQEYMTQIMIQIR